MTRIASNERARRRDVRSTRSPLHRAPEQETILDVFHTIMCPTPHTAALWVMIKRPKLNKNQHGCKKDSFCGVDSHSRCRRITNGARYLLIVVWNLCLLMLCKWYLPVCRVLLCYYYYQPQHCDKYFNFVIL